MLGAIAGIFLAAAQPGLFDADGYRAASYRAPVDRDPWPAAHIALAAARDLRPGRDALFIDALPLGRNAGQWVQTETHETIAGAIWRPEVGRPGVDPALWAGLRGTIAAWRRGHPGGPVVLFCRTDCWMGWNAARRLAREGVGDVYWLAEGVEGWRDTGGELRPATPQPQK
ncbi:rhodanese [Novosphingobium sp. KACC 22771]|uniref:rhodanese n=1 Tax=Novosphingobium sp. KACC 22771 TaxID=3025670 RepID=UPI002366DE58|nr:rhodanese [Novosphingobium sp. KACC 22771]WDF70973.1 rhodanese [Novosphingobium sp. KACC 22771]